MSSLLCIYDGSGEMFAVDSDISSSIRPVILKVFIHDTVSLPYQDQISIMMDLCVIVAHLAAAHWRQVADQKRDVSFVEDYRVDALEGNIEAISTFNSEDSQRIASKSQPPFRLWDWILRGMGGHCNTSRRRG
jgi:hypothetical protein